MMKRTALHRDPTVLHKLGRTERQEQRCQTAYPEENLRHRSHYPYTFIGHSRHRDPTKQSHALTSDSRGPSPENRPTINTHRPPAGQRLSPTQFKIPAAAIPPRLLSKPLPPRRWSKTALHYVL